MNGNNGVANLKLETSLLLHHLWTIRRFTFPSHLGTDTILATIPRMT
jgi:hypothetical protein